MAKPLDGTAFHSYCHRLKFHQQTRDLLETIRSSPPSRTPGSSYGNMAVWYPSKKMRCIIKAESHKVEFAFLLEAEHDDTVLEFFDQPPPIPLEYPDKHGRVQRPQHTADYFIFHYDSAGWEECKPVEKLMEFAQQGSTRYVFDEKKGQWRCPPGEEYAARYGLTYRVRVSDQINWAAQDNWLYLEDYYQDMEKLVVPDKDLEVLYQLVDEHPGISLTDLRTMADAVSSDRINIAIAQHALYVDLNVYRLTEPERAPIFRTHRAARAYCHRSKDARFAGIFAHPVLIDQGNTIIWDGKLWLVANAGQTEITLISETGEPVPLPCATFEAWVKEGKIVGSPSEVCSSITPEGQALLEQADDVDIATAVFRNRVINPDQYYDDEQQRNTATRAAVPRRTRFNWKKWYRDAESQYGSGFIGLLPNYHECGKTKKLDPHSRELIDMVLQTHYDTVTKKPKRGAFGEYLRLCKEQSIPSTTQRTFYAEVQRHKTAYEQTLVREGKRAAYPFKEYHHMPEKTISRHGDYAWSMAHIDHTELDLILCDSKTGQPIGKCWLTLMILSATRRIVAYYLTFDPPSYRSCMMVLRLCVKRYGRLPTAITVDGGSEFESIYFEQLLALYRVRKHQRPAAEPRFGSPQERLFGTMDTEFIYHLLGNTQATKRPRTMTKSTDPRRQAVWTLPSLAERLQQWADEEYDTIRHPSLGQSPCQAYEQSMGRDGQRIHKLIPYDDTFRMATFPTTRKGVALVQPGVGVRMNHLDYWCEAMRDATVERTQVKVRYDPFDVSVGYAYIDGKWRQCITPYNEFAGCSERELQLLAEELRKRNRIQNGREQVELTQKQLAAFRRENTDVETVLRQQRHDRETRAALFVLEGGKGQQNFNDQFSVAPPSMPEPESRSGEQSQIPKRNDPREQKAKKQDKLLVFRRIHS